MRRRDYLAALAALGALAGCTEEVDTDGEAENDAGGDGGDGGGDGGDEDTPTATPADEATATPTAESGDTATAEPTGESTAEPTDTPAPTANSPEPQSFEGSGQKVTDDVDMVEGLTIVEGTHDGDSNFQVEFVPSEGEFNELFVNAIGSYDGATAALIDADTYKIDVTADGDWTLTVRQPRPQSGDAPEQSLSGDKPAVHGPYEFAGSHTATGSHDGESNFQVHVYPLEGIAGELVFNEIGSVDDAQTTFSHDGIGFVDVAADGKWSLEIE